MEYKVCTKCGKKLEDTKVFFYLTDKNTGRKDSVCKVCRGTAVKNNYYKKVGREKLPVLDKEEVKQRALDRKRNYYQANKEKILKKERLKYRTNIKYQEKRKQYQKEYREKAENKIKIKNRDGDYAKRPENYERIKAYQDEYRNRADRKALTKTYNKQYKPTHREETRQRHAYRTVHDKGYKAGMILRSSLKSIFRCINTNKIHTTEVLLGYTQQELIHNFDNCTYTWDDYMQGGFHLDHIIPVAYFAKKIQLTVDNELTVNDLQIIKNCNALRNLRIIPASENISKKDKLDMELIKEYGITELL